MAQTQNRAGGGSDLGPQYPGPCKSVDLLSLIEGCVSSRWEDPEDECWKGTYIGYVEGSNVEITSLSQLTIVGTVTTRNQYKTETFFSYNTVDKINTYYTLALIPFSEDGFSVESITTRTVNSGVFMKL